MRYLLLGLWLPLAAQTVCISVDPVGPTATVITCPTTPAPISTVSYTFGTGLVATSSPGSPTNVTIDTSLVPQKFVTQGPPTGIKGSRLGDLAYDMTNGFTPYQCRSLTCDASGFQAFSSGSGTPGPQGPPGPAGPQGPQGPAGSGAGLTQVAPPTSNTSQCSIGSWAVSADKRIFYWCIGGTGQTWLAMSSFSF